MKIPAGIKLEDNGADASDYVLEIHRNIYGQKQAGRVWNNKFLVDQFVNELVGFQQSNKVDECVFNQAGTMMYKLYTENSLIAGPNKREINKIIEELKTKTKLVPVDETSNHFQEAGQGFAHCCAAADALYCHGCTSHRRNDKQYDQKTLGPAYL